ncbi:MAG: hypothetical protein AAFV53_43780, partial [Myxococcota bacterium]
MPNSLEKRIDVKVGLTRPLTNRARVPRICVVGIAPQGSPLLSEEFPSSKVRVTQLSLGGTESVEQLRFSAKSERKPMPHIASQTPSRIRDGFQLALASGASEIDVLLCRGEGLNPWDLDRRQVSEMLGPFLGEMPGTLLVFPDAGGPWPNNRAALVPVWERMVRLRDTVRNFQTLMMDHYQIGFMDMVQGTPQENRQILLGIAGSDVVLCQWTGTREMMRRHGWRSGCAALAGHLSSKDANNVTQGVVGQLIPLDSGRYFTRSRARALGEPPLPPIDSVVADTCAVLELQSGQGAAEIMSAPTFRRPLGEWTVSSVRTVKLIHRHLVQAADMFVFRPAREVEATALGASVDLALQPFFERGIVTGPDGSGPPIVNSGVIR